MARNMYGATSADFTLTSGGRVVPGAVLTIWSARTGGTQITDLLDVDSVACTTVTSAADGSVVYYGPNNDKTVHWADSGQGSRIAIRPVDITGDPPVLSIGTVTTGAAAANLTGTSESPVLNLTLPTAGANGVDTAAIQDGAVTAAKIANDTITATQVAANAVGASELADSAVDTAAIADSAVTSAKIADGTITAAQIAANAVGASELADNAVDTAAIADSAVTSAKIADGTIVSGDVAADTFAAFGTVGNLLTTAQAGGDSGWGSNGTFAAGTAGDGVFQITTTWGYITASPRTPVTAGDTITISATLAPVGEHALILTEFKDASTGGSTVSTVYGNVILAGQSGLSQLTTVVPAGATHAEVLIYAGGSGADSVTVTKPGVWKGAGGDWAMPGTPITNTGIRPNPSNTAEVQIWNDATSTWITV